MTGSTITWIGADHSFDPLPYCAKIVDVGISAAVDAGLEVFSNLLRNEGKIFASTIIDTAHETTQNEHCTSRSHGTSENGRISGKTAARCNMTSEIFLQSIG